MDNSEPYADRFSELTDLIYSAAPDGPILAANQAWCTALGYSSAQARLLHTQDIVHPDSYAAYTQQLRQMLDGDAIERFETVLVTRDGRPLAVEGTVDWLVQNGEPLELRARFHDITARREIEHALAESAAQFQAAIDPPSIVAFVSADAGQIMYANQRMLRHLGAHPAALTGQADATNSGALRALDQATVPGTDAVAFEAVVPMPDGMTATWLCLKIPVADATGQPLMANIALDLTRRAGYERQLIEQQLRLEARVRELELAARTDPLTQLPNKHEFEQRLLDECSRALRYSAPLSLLVFDVDDFKDYNDTFGHPAGDSVLRQVAQLLHNQSRTSDHVARFGGDEFGVLLPNTPADGALIVAERMRRVIEGGRWSHRRITVSGGVVSLAASFSTGADLIAAADDALYQAKHSGRNQLIQSSAAFDD